MDLKSILRPVVENLKRGRTEEEIISENLKKEIQVFNEKYQVSVREPLSKIPTFYTNNPNEDDLIIQKLKQDARALYLENRSRLLPENEELKAVWNLLDKYYTPPLVNEEKFISYEDYKKVMQQAGKNFAPYLDASLFAKLQDGDPLGRVSTTAIFNYALRKVWLHQTRIGLSLYDVTGHGYLREDDLEQYIRELIPTLPHLNGLEKSFYSFYICTAARKFFFFLDPLRTGRIRIQDVLVCNFLDELLELRVDDVSKDVLEANWFSAPSALRVYGQYLNLDRDHNGMLSKEELAGYGTGTLTQAFIDRVFQEYLTYDGEMDYKTYLDLVLALENRHEPQSLRFFFRVLDVNTNGYLDTFSINYFYRAIQEQMSAHGQEPVKFENVQDEIFDMVKPVDPTKITLKDILTCGQGDVMISILIDLNGFWTYENREALAGETSEDPL